MPLSVSPGDHCAQALHLPRNSADPPGPGFIHLDEYDVSESGSELSVEGRVRPDVIGTFPDQPQSDVCKHAGLAHWAGGVAGLLDRTPVSNSLFPDDELSDYPSRRETYGASPG